jgi:hypothetical protein
MISMTYGTLPSRREFIRACGAKNLPDGIYTISGRPAERDGVAGDYTCQELYALVRQLTARWRDGEEGAGSWASDILGTLGFEWV